MCNYSSLDKAMQCQVFGFVSIHNIQENEKLKINITW